MAYAERDHARPRRAAAGAEQRNGSTPEDRRTDDVRWIVDSLPAMVGYWGADLHNRFANRAYREFFEVTPEALRSMDLRELLGPELYELQVPHIKRVLDGEPQLFDRMLTDRHGRRRYTQAAYVPDVVDGQVVGFVVLVTDITERRMAELAREAAEARFSLAFEASPVGMGLLDPEGRLTNVNTALCTMLGYSHGELSGRPLVDLIEPANGKRERAKVATLLSRSSDSPLSSECRFARKDGSTVWTILNLSVATNDEVIGIAQIQDISDRKRAEDELRASRERLAEAERVAHMGSWEYDLRTDRAIWSAGLLEMHGLSEEQFDPTWEGAAEQRLFPADREFVQDTVRRAIAERSSFELEYRIIRQDGRVRTLSSRGDVVCDERGEPLRIVGTAQDVTDARLAEEALRNRSADLERRELELQKLALRDASQRQPEPRAPLTGRQFEVLRLIAQGKTSAEIAEELAVTEGTVKWHVKQILAKTASASRAEAVARVLGGDV